METATQTTETSLKALWEKAEKEAENSLAKISLLKKFKPENGLTIIQQPGFFPLSTLERVCRCIGKVIFLKFEEVNEIFLYNAHNYSFVLARNGSKEHGDYEQKQKISGGSNSEEILDIGEFRIANTKDDDILRYADFSLFRIKD